MDLRNKTIQAVKWNFLSTALGTVIGIVQLWALSRILPTHEYGVMGAAFIVIQFFNIFIDFGISSSIVRSKTVTELELSSLYAISVALGVVNFIIAFGLSPWIGEFFKSEEVVVQVRIMAFTFLLAAFGQQQRAILVREMRFNLISIVAVITLVVNFVSIIVLALIFRKAWVASVAALLGTAVSCGIFFVQGLRERKLSFTFDWPSARPHLRYAISLVGDSLINVVSVNTFPVLMARMVSMTAIGGYNIANGISINLIERLKPVLTQALFPAFAKIQDDGEKLARNFLLVTTFGSLVNFPLLVGTFITSSAILSCFFKPEWAFVADLVKVLCLAGMFRSLDPPVISLLLVKAKMYLNVRLGIPKLVLGIALATWLGTRFGIHGIVSSFLVVQAANTIVGYFVMVRSCLPGIGLAYLKSVLMPLAQTLPIAVVAGLLTVFPPTAYPVVNLGLAVAGGALGYVAGLWFSPFATVREFLQLGLRNVSPRLARMAEHHAGANSER